MLFLLLAIILMLVPIIAFQSPTQTAPVHQFCTDLSIRNYVCHDITSEK